MTDVATKGTARLVFKGTPYSVACKTGTAQVITVGQDDKYDAKKLHRKYHDHALFIAFAPARNPRIAIAVLVENGGCPQDDGLLADRRERTLPAAAKGRRAD